MEQRPPKIVEIILALTSTAAAVYMTLPPQERLWLKMSLAQKLHHVSTKLAWKIGHKGMADELAGRDYQRYGIAYRISKLRDALSRKLQEMRP